MQREILYTKQQGLSEKGILKKTIALTNLGGDNITKLNKILDELTGGGSSTSSIVTALKNSGKSDKTSQNKEPTNTILPKSSSSDSEIENAEKSLSSGVKRKLKKWRHLKKMMQCQGN